MASIFNVQLTFSVRFEKGLVEAAKTFLHIATGAQHA
jgi:hypothetical protein